MSYRLAAYAIDIDRLKAVFGSKNEKLVSMIKSCRERDFEQHDEYFADQIANGCPTIGDALEQIAMGVIQGRRKPDFSMPTRPRRCVGRWEWNFQPSTSVLFPDSDEQV